VIGLFEVIIIYFFLMFAASGIDRTLEERAGEREMRDWGP